MRPLSALAAPGAVALALALAPSGGAAASAGPTSTLGPAAIGAPVVGQRLTGELGTWRGSGAIAYRYQWYRCDGGGAHCSSIHGATGQSYRVVTADAAHTIGLTVTATDPSGAASAYASLVGPVAAAAADLVSTVQPTVAGTVRQGGSIRATAGAWSRTPASVSYAWLRCNPNGRICAPVAGASADAYTATAADLGHALVAVVTATLGGSRQSALSTTATAAAATAPSPAPSPPSGGPASSAAPTVSGTAVQGGQLAGTAGTWSGSGTLAYAFQWYRCDAAGAHCSSVHGATAATYRLGILDAAHTIGLTVRATDSTGTRSAYASLVGPVASAGATLAASAQPTVSGTATGKPLTVSTGTWTTAPASYDYSWQRCNANGRLCAPIAGATAASYTVTAADAGHALLAVVQAVAGNSTAQALSKAVLVS